MDRLKFAFDHMRYVRQKNCYELLIMQDSIHADDKWFYATNNKETHYLTSSNKNPHHTTEWKSFVSKSMFFTPAAVQHDTAGYLIKLSNPRVIHFVLSKGSNFIDK